MGSFCSALRILTKHGQNWVCGPNKQNGTVRNKIFERIGTVGPPISALPILTKHGQNWVCGPTSRMEQGGMVFWAERNCGSAQFCPCLVPVQLQIAILWWNLVSRTPEFEFHRCLMHRYVFRQSWFRIECGWLWLCVQLNATAKKLSHHEGIKNFAILSKPGH